MAELIKVNAPVRKPLFEGVQGENEARSIQFDIEPWVTELGDGAVTATAKRSQDSQPYPVTVTKDGNIVTWKPTSTDTAYAGVGSFQLEYTVDSVLAKTCIWSTMVAPSLDPAGDPPDPYDNWLAEMREIAADAIQAAQDADASADDAQAEVYEAEAWAKGTKNGTPVSSSDAQYQNNAKYYSEESYKNAEAWAVGQRGGVDVPSTDPAYENNAKYWAEQSLANQYGAYIVKSASGEIASFSDGADDVPMKSLNVTITPKQTGSGDPSPSNVRPISGWTDADVNVVSSNIFDGVWERGLINGTTGQNVANSSTIRSKNYIPVKGGSKICGAFKDLPNNFVYLYEYKADKTYNLTSYETLRNGSITLKEDTAFVRIRADDLIENIGENPLYMLQYGEAHSAYEPYNGTTTPVPLGQTVYGGEVDVISGVLTVNTAFVTYDGSSDEEWTDNGANGVYLYLGGNTHKEVIAANIYKAVPKSGTLADYTCKINTGGVSLLVKNPNALSAADFKAALASQNLQIVYELATTTTVQLTPTQVATLLGTNNVLSDAGAVEVEYRADPTLAYNELANVIVSLGGNI